MLLNLMYVLTMLLDLMIGVMLGVDLMMIEQEQIAMSLRINLALRINLGLKTGIIGVYIMRRTGLNSKTMMLFLGLVTTANA